MILAQGPRSLLLIDPYEHQEGGCADGVNFSPGTMQWLYQELVKKYQAEPRIKILRKFSTGAALSVEPSSLDFVYIDANHTAAACLADMRAWLRTLRPGGWLCGHDFAFEPVRAAAREFLSEHPALELHPQLPGDADNWKIRV